MHFKRAAYNSYGDRIHLGTGFRPHGDKADVEDYWERSPSPRLKARPIIDNPKCLDCGGRVMQEHGATKVGSFISSCNNRLKRLVSLVGGSPFVPRSGADGALSGGKGFGLCRPRLTSRSLACHRYGNRFRSDRTLGSRLRAQAPSKASIMFEKGNGMMKIQHLPRKRGMSK